MIKMFLGLVIVLFVLCLSLFVICKMSGREDCSKNMLGNKLAYNKSAQQDSEWGDRKEKTSTVRLFGTIVKVEGNVITVKDNSAQEQVILSQATTVILSTEGEVGISVLKAGADIVALGTYDKDSQLVAKVINLVK